MYESFYKLSADPFRLTPDPRFCYAHQSFGRARAYMRYAIDQGEGFVVVTGRPGTGKTTLIEAFLSELSDREVVAARLLSTHMRASDDLLHLVAHAFGLATGSAGRVALIQAIERFLMDQARVGRRTVLVVDEAQDLSAESLEALRLLTNLQVGPRAVLQIFLLGQEQLRAVVNDPGLEQLRQRILASSQLEALDAEQTREYVLHRLRCAGWQGDPQLSPRAFALIHIFSQGLPRNINKLSGRLLLYGCLEDKHALVAEDVLTVVNELRDEQLIELGIPGEENLAADVSDVVEPPLASSALRPEQPQSPDSSAPAPQKPVADDDPPLDPEEEESLDALIASQAFSEGHRGGPSAAEPHFDIDVSLAIIEEQEAAGATRSREHPQQRKSSNRWWKRLRHLLLAGMFVLLAATPSLRHSPERQANAQAPAATQDERPSNAGRELSGTGQPISSAAVPVSGASQRETDRPPVHVEPMS